MRARLVFRLAIAVATLPCLWVGTAGARYLLRTQAADRRAAQDLPLDLALPGASDRYLIVAPHPDDETLACGGLMQRAIRAGAEVRVVFVTCGDGYRTAVEREFRKLQITPEDYFRFGAVRRDEAREAARALGLRPTHLRFIGMPDGRITDLWRRYWTDALTVPQTGAACVPYTWATRPALPYAGLELMRQIEDEIAAFRPTHVLIPHPSDDHGDHAAVSAFARTAMLRMEHGRMGATPVVLHYLVHRGDWPQPQGLRSTLPLAPPAEMTGLDTEWHGLALRDAEIAAKARAIRAYRSQTTVMPRYMLSFVRSTEFFGVIPDARAPAMTASLSVAPTLMGRAVPVALDAVDDSLLRRMQAQCDIRTVLAAASRDALYLMVETVKPPTRTATMRVYARTVPVSEHDDDSGSAEVTLRGGRVQGAANAMASAYGHGTSVVVPLERASHGRAVLLDVETSVAGVVVDRTGPRVVHLGTAD